MIGIRRITDISELLAWRREVIENVFGEEPSEGLLEENRKYYVKHIGDGTHLAYLAIMDDEEVGCGSICLSDELPSPDNPSGHCAYIMNIYVRKNYREKGAGHAIVRRLIEEAEKRNCGKIYLETTSEGRNLYASLGFNDLPDMMKFKMSEEE